MITPLVQKLAALSAVDFAPVQFAPRLAEITAKLPCIPPDLAEYLDGCLLADSYGDLIELHGYERLIEENESLLPGAENLVHGFLCIAREQDGSQFAYSCHDGRVYHIFEDPGASPQEIVEGSDACWQSLADFLQECIHSALDEE